MSPPPLPVAVPAPAPSVVTDPSTLSQIDFTDVAMYAAIGVGALVGGYHGYRRHDDSAGWAAVWALAGAVAPPITVAAALLQGYAQPSDSVRIRRTEELVAQVRARLSAQHPELVETAPSA